MHCGLGVERERTQSHCQENLRFEIAASGAVTLKLRRLGYGEEYVRTTGRRNGLGAGGSFLKP